MTNNIVEIDLDKLDAEIVSLQQQIDLLMNTKRYAMSMGMKQKSTSASTPVVARKSAGRKPGKKNATKKATVVPKAAPKKAGRPGRQPKVKGTLGVTDFILAFLKGNGHSDANTIIKAFATYAKKTEKQVTGNVSNALSRLKTAKKANNKPKADGKKKGTEWFIA